MRGSPAARCRRLSLAKERSSAVAVPQCPAPAAPAASAAVSGPGPSSVFSPRSPHLSFSSPLFSEGICNTGQK